MIHLSNPELPLQFVFEVENIFDNQELEFLSSYFSNKNLVEANLTTKKVNKEIRKTDIAWLDPEDATEHIYHKLFSLVKHVNDQHYHWNLTWIETIQYGEYGEGGLFRIRPACGMRNDDAKAPKMATTERANQLAWRRR